MQVSRRARAFWRLSELAIGTNRSRTFLRLSPPLRVNIALFSHTSSEIAAPAVYAPNCSTFRMERSTSAPLAHIPAAVSSDAQPPSDLSLTPSLPGAWCLTTPGSFDLSLRTAPLEDDFPRHGSEIESPTWSSLLSAWNTRDPNLLPLTNKPHEQWLLRPGFDTFWEPRDALDTLNPFDQAPGFPRAGVGSSVFGLSSYSCLDTPTFTDGLDVSCSFSSFLQELSLLQRHSEVGSLLEEVGEDPTQIENNIQWTETPISTGPSPGDSQAWYIATPSELQYSPSLSEDPVFLAGRVKSEAHSSRAGRAQSAPASPTAARLTTQPTVKAQQRLHPCRICDKSFGGRRNLNRHLATVHKNVFAGGNKRQYTCPALHCRFGRNGFSRRDKLVRHWRWMHEDLGTLDAAQSSQKAASVDGEEDKESAGWSIGSGGSNEENRAAD